MLGEFSAANRQHCQDERKRHDEPEQQPHGVQDFAVPGRPGVEMRHPHPAQRRGKSGWDEDTRFHFQLLGQL
jgi:hypothetical protein